METTKSPFNESPSDFPALLEDEFLYELADFFKVFGDSSRLKLLWCLRQGERCVSQLSEVLNMSAPAISHQLKVLRQNHLVRMRRDGKNVYYSLADDHVLSILDTGLEHLSE